MKGGDERTGSSHSDGKCTMMQERKGNAESQTRRSFTKALAQTSVFLCSVHREESLIIFVAAADIILIISDDTGR